MYKLYSARSLTSEKDGTGLVWGVGEVQGVASRDGCCSPRKGGKGIWALCFALIGRHWKHRHQICGWLQTGRGQKSEPFVENKEGGNTENQSKEASIRYWLCDYSQGGKKRVMRTAEETKDFMESRESKAYISSALHLQDGLQLMLKGRKEQ